MMVTGHMTETATFGIARLYLLTMNHLTMNQFYEEQDIVIREVIEKFDIEIIVPSVNDESFITMITPLLQSDDYGRTVLGSTMAFCLAQVCNSTRNYEPLLSLAGDLTLALNRGAAVSAMEVEAQEIRATLFWVHVFAVRGKDIRYLDASSRLMNALSRGSAKRTRSADAALAQRIWESGATLQE